ncbi:MAG: hypothetical protein KQJ78_05655 [Deltaproteobacteria bacterium]|nr:hypothetical protein [Deltaproteobacteria bacterium]
MKGDMIISGAGSLEGARFWSSDPARQSPREGDLGAQPDWSLIFERPVDRLGRMDPLCRQVLAAAELTGLPLPPPGQERGDLALVLGTQFGCLAVDYDFEISAREPGAASPLLFMYTLPSMALGEVAIRHRATGSNLCVMAGADSGLLALYEGLRLLNLGEARAALVLAGDALSPQTVALMNQTPETLCPPEPFAFALLLEKTGVQACGLPPLARVQSLEVSLGAPPARTPDARAHLAALMGLLAAREPGRELTLPPPAALPHSTGLGITRL